VAETEESLYVDVAVGDSVVAVGVVVATLTNFIDSPPDVVFFPSSSSTVSFFDAETKDS
jgi:hypothetical protein